MTFFVVVVYLRQRFHSASSSLQKHLQPPTAKARCGNTTALFHTGGRGQKSSLCLLGLGLAGSGESDPDARMWDAGILPSVCATRTVANLQTHFCKCIQKYFMEHTAPKKSLFLWNSGLTRHSMRFLVFYFAKFGHPNHSIVRGMCDILSVSMSFVPNSHRHVSFHWSSTRENLSMTFGRRIIGSWI